MFYNHSVFQEEEAVEWEGDWGQHQKLLQESSWLYAAAGVWGCPNPMPKLHKNWHFWKTAGWVLSSKTHPTCPTCFPPASLCLSFEFQQVLILFSNLSWYSHLPTQILPGNQSAWVADNRPNTPTVWKRTTPTSGTIYSVTRGRKGSISISQQWLQRKGKVECCPKPEPVSLEPWDANWTLSSHSEPRASSSHFVHSFVRLLLAMISHLLNSHIVLLMSGLRTSDPFSLR